MDFFDVLRKGSEPKSKRFMCVVATARGCCSNWRPCKN